MVDGLQRLSTILSFFGLLEDEEKNNFQLIEGDIIKELKDLNKANIPLKLSNSIKRSVCRIEILRWDSNFDMRYELFKRLNTSVEPLTEQEVRNCIFRGNDNGFNTLLKELSQDENFKKIADIQQAEEIQMFGEELILRIFCFQYDYEITNSLSKHLTLFMKKVTEKKIDFDCRKSKENFLELLQILERDFFRMRGGKTLLSHRLWDAIWYPIYKHGKGNINIKEFVKKVQEEIKKANISTRTTHQNRPKKAIEIGLQEYNKLKNGN